MFRITPFLKQIFKILLQRRSQKIIEKYLKNYVNVHVVTTFKKHQKDQLKKTRKWLQNHLKINVGSHSRACPIILSSLNHSRSIFFNDFYAFYLPNGSQNGPQNQSKINPEASWPLGRAPGRPKMPPGPHFGLIFNDFGYILD